MNQSFIRGFTKQAEQYGISAVQAERFCAEYIKLANDKTTDNKKKHSQLVKLLSAAVMGTGGMLVGQGMGSLAYGGEPGDFNRGAGMGGILGAYNGYRNSEKLF